MQNNIVKVGLILFILGLLMLILGIATNAYYTSAKETYSSLKLESLSLLNSMSIFIFVLGNVFIFAGGILITYGYA